MPKPPHLEKYYGDAARARLHERGLTHLRVTTRHPCVTHIRGLTAITRRDPQGGVGEGEETPIHALVPDREGGAVAAGFAAFRRWPSTC